MADRNKSINRIKATLADRNGNIDHTRAAPEIKALLQAIEFLLSEPLAPGLENL